jgi:hypothetical protein
MREWIRTVAGRHPSSARLVELATGGSLDSSLARHLDACAKCRRNLAALRDDWDRLRAAEAATSLQKEPDLDGVLCRIFAVIRSSAGSKSISAAVPAGKGRQLSQRLIELMDDCFGVCARTAARGSLDELSDPSHALARSGALLNTFLGRKIATQITDQVLSELRMNGG